MRGTNDLLRAVDDHGEAVLVLLDFSAAFDTMDHQILLKRLSARYRVTGKAHQWFSSYLENRKQSVIIDDEISNPTCLDWGVSQGAVVGPELFLVFSAPIEDIINKHGYQVFPMLTAHRSTLLSSQIIATAQYRKLRTVLRTYASGWLQTSSY